MPALPGSLALTNIADGASIVAADHRNNYAAIQSAMNALIALFSNGSLDGEAMVWDATNTKWVNASSLASTRPRAPRVVTSTMAGGPPASPQDQDIWVATAVDANGTRWAFQYNAASASAFKWEFIGGTPLYVNGATPATAINAQTQVAASGFYYVPAVTAAQVARAGDYEVSGRLQVDPNGGAAGNVIVEAFAGTTRTQLTQGTTPGTATQINVPVAGLVTAAAADFVGGCVSTPANGTYKFYSDQVVWIVPRRIS